MIRKEFHETRPDGVNLYRTYSDEGFYIVQNETGAEYAEAIDVEGAPYTYTESDKKIEEPEDEVIAEHESIINESNESEVE